MKIEVPIPIAPRSAVGAISPKYWGWTQMATPVKIKPEFNYIYQDNITLIIKMYFWIIYPHLFQWKNVQWWVIQIILLGNSDPSAEQPLMQICYWSAVPLSWKNIGLQLQIMKYNIELGFSLNVFFLSAPPQLHRQRPTDCCSYESSYGEYRHNSGPKQGENLFWYVRLVTLPPGLVDEFMHILEIKGGKHRHLYIIVHASLPKTTM